MSDTIRKKLIEIVSPFVKNKELLENVDNSASFLKRPRSELVAFS